MSLKSARVGSVLFSIAVMIAFVLISFAYISPFARTYDEVDFALALHRYDLLAMQPHFPGYPYFILGGMVIHNWVADPIQALSIFNTLLALSSMIPMLLIVRRYTNTHLGLLFATIVLTSPSLWLMSAQAMSEGAAIAVLWWYLWSVRRAFERSSSKAWHLLPLFLFGILMGIRVSFFPFGLAIVWLWVTQFKGSEQERLVKWRLLLLQMLFALCCQLLWVGGLAWSEGGPVGFVRLSYAFVKGHFTDWGGGVGTSTIPLGERLLHFFVDNLLWSSGLGHSIGIGIVFSLWIAVIVLGIRLCPTIKLGVLAARYPYLFWLLSCILLYTLWALFGQNIQKPRHITPIIGLLLMFIYVVAVRIALLLRSARRIVLSTLIYILMIALILTQLTYGAHILKRQANEAPSIYQLHSDLASIDEPFILYTWEEARVLQYIQADYLYKEILTYNYFLSEVKSNPDRLVLLTDHVLSGFEQQAGSLRNHVREVGRYESDSLYDPVYHNVIVYEWLRNL
jgi:hypothetical protein